MKSCRYPHEDCTIPCTAPVVTEMYVDGIGTLPVCFGALMNKLALAKGGDWAKGKPDASILIETVCDGLRYAPKAHNKIRTLESKIDELEDKIKRRLML